MSGQERFLSCHFSPRSLIIPVVPRVIRKIAESALVLAVVLTMAGCDRQPPDYKALDEETLRSELSIPKSAALLTYQCDPSITPGFYGREGLRIFAVFQLDKASLQAYRANVRPDEWKETPVPDELLDLKYGPEELAAVDVKGYFLADIAAWVNKSTPPWQAYHALGIPKHIARYRVVVTDTNSSKLFIVSKNYYLEGAKKRAPP